MKQIYSSIVKIVFTILLLVFLVPTKSLSQSIVDHGFQYQCNDLKAASVFQVFFASDSALYFKFYDTYTGKKSNGSPSKWKIENNILYLINNNKGITICYKIKWESKYTLKLVNPDDTSEILTLSKINSPEDTYFEKLVTERNGWFVGRTFRLQYTKESNGYIYDITFYPDNKINTRVKNIDSGEFADNKGVYSIEGNKIKLKYEKESEYNTVDYEWKSYSEFTFGSVQRWVEANTYNDTFIRDYKASQSSK